MNKKVVKIVDLYKDIKNPYLKAEFAKHTYPWEILPKIKDMVKEMIANPMEGYHLLQEGILVGENVSIAPTATLIPPIVIGSGTEIRPGAYLRGNIIIGENCVVGNSSELKNCILIEKVQAPHYNYVGDAILGYHAHMGAGSILSNLKSDGKNVVIHGDVDYETGLRKIGSFLADNADIGCNSVLNPGTVIGPNTQVYPLSCLRGVFPENSIVKSQNNVVDKR